MAVAHGMTSCDDHEAIDKNIYVGHVLCSDGHVASYEECQKQGKEPVAVVFYTSRETTEDGDGLAIGLREIPAVAFSDTLGVNQGTSTDTDSKCGNANTFALYSNNKAELAMPILLPFIPTTRQSHLLQRRSSPSGDMARVPISPV